MKFASPKEAPARAFELARALEERLGMPATLYMTSRESTSRRAPRTGTVVPARSIPAAASPEAKPAGPLDRYPGRRFGRWIGSGEVAGAIIAALRFGLLATGLGWLAAGLL